MRSQDAAGSGDPVPFIMRLGRALHGHGAPAHRLEEALGQVSRQLRIEAQFFSTPTSIFAAFGPTGQQRMVLERVEPGDVHLGQLAALDDLLDDFARGEISVAGAEARLRSIEEEPVEPRTLPLVGAYGLVGLSGAFFFRGSGVDVALAGAVGGAVGALVGTLGRVHAARRLIDLSAATLAAFLAGLAGTRSAEVQPFVVTLASLLVLLPGLSLTTATTELASKHFVAGGSRFAGTVVVLVTLGFGAALGTHLATRAFGAPAPVGPAPLSWWFVPPALLASALGLLVSFRAERRDFVWVLSGAAIAYGAVQAGVRILGNVELGALLGAFALGLYANVVARVGKRPAAVVSLPGLVLLVPGSVGFRSVASLVQADTISGIQTAVSMLMVAVAIVTGLLVANAILPSRRAL